MRVRVSGVLLAVLVVLGAMMAPVMAQDAAQSPDQSKDAAQKAGGDAAAGEKAGEEVTKEADKAIEEASGAPNDLPPGLPPVPEPLNSNTPDPLNLGAAPDNLEFNPSNTLPPFSAMNSDSTVSPAVERKPEDGLELGLDRRIRETEQLLNRMVWQLHRETAWANSVHDIIQNYQYKYSKVLTSIKKHTDTTKKMRALVSDLKKAKLHEVLESDLAKATKELTELASSSSETAEDEGSYASLKDRVALMKQDLEKMAHAKVHKQVHGVIEKLKGISEEAVPGDSKDTLKGLIGGK